LEDVQEFNQPLCGDALHGLHGLELGGLVGKVLGLIFRDEDLRGYLGVLVLLKLFNIHLKILFVKR